MTTVSKDTEPNASPEDIQDKKVVCSKCGGQLRLREVSVWDIPEDGTYEWEKPIYSKCNMSCTVCGHSPGFENDLGKVILDEDDGQEYENPPG